MSWEWTILKLILACKSPISVNYNSFVSENSTSELGHFLILRNYTMHSEYSNSPVPLQQEPAKHWYYYFHKSYWHNNDTPTLHCTLSWGLPPSTAPCSGALHCTLSWGLPPSTAPCPGDSHPPLHPALRILTLHCTLSWGLPPSTAPCHGDSHPPLHPVMGTTTLHCTLSWGLPSSTAPCPGDSHLPLHPVLGTPPSTAPCPGDSHPPLHPFLGTPTLHCTLSWGLPSSTAPCPGDSHLPLHPVLGTPTLHCTLSYGPHPPLHPVLGTPILHCTLSWGPPPSTAPCPGDSHLPLHPGPGDSHPPLHPGPGDSHPPLHPVLGTPTLHCTQPREESFKVSLAGFQPQLCDGDENWATLPAPHQQSFPPRLASKYSVCPFHTGESQHLGDMFTAGCSKLMCNKIVLTCWVNM